MYTRTYTLHMCVCMCVGAHSRNFYPTEDKQFWNLFLFFSSLFSDAVEICILQCEF